MYIRNAVNQLNEVNSRVDVMLGHLRNIQQELMNSQNLYEAKNREAETEVHMKQLSEREMGKLKVEIEQLEKQEAELKDRVSRFLLQIFECENPIFFTRVVFTSLSFLVIFIPCFSLAFFLDSVLLLLALVPSSLLSLSFCPTVSSSSHLFLRSRVSLQLNVLQNTMFKTNEKLEEFRTKMDFNQEELEQWVAVEKKKEDDNLNMLKYTQADNAKIKELTLQIEKLTKETQRKKAELDAEVMKRPIKTNT